MSLRIKRAMLGGKMTDIYIEDHRIAEISEKIPVESEKVIDAKGCAAIPAMYNTHSHAGMALLRGYADDMPLMEWLKTKIWPLEAKMTAEDIYHGSRLACLEMIKSGTVFFNDMYWHPEMTIKAAQEMGMRAAIGLTLLDSAGRSGSKNTVKKNFSDLHGKARNISLTIAPHALYTVAEENLEWAKTFAEKRGLMMHFHLSETATEVENCMDEHGLRPVNYLEKLGFLSSRLITAHNVHLLPGEIRILAKHGVKMNHNPVSNMKLSVGSAFSYKAIKDAGLSVSLGTDGCSSNNNLDMIEQMKFASLLQKHHYNDPTRLTSHEAFAMATRAGAQQFGIDAGEIKEGKVADLLLIDLRNPCMTPGHTLISDLVYSANGSCVDTTICDGNVLMEHRKVAGEKEILEEACRAASDLYSR